MGHEVQDRASLEMARRIAADLPRHPQWLNIARANISRWSQQNQDAPTLLRCYAEWKELLDRPLAEIAATLTNETDEGQRLRQNSPFVGILTPRQVWEIKRNARSHEKAAT